MTVNKILWAATVVSIAAYQLWPFWSSALFFIGIALFIFIIVAVIFYQNRKLFISFFLLCIAFNNLLDELFFDPKSNGLNEIVIILILPLVWYLKVKRNARKNNQQ